MTIQAYISRLMYGHTNVCEILFLYGHTNVCELLFCELFFEKRANTLLLQASKQFIWHVEDIPIQFVR